MRAPVSRTVERAFAVFAAERAALAGADDATVSLQLDIARIPSPTGGEGSRAAFVAQRLRAAGLATRTDDAGNVIAHWGSASAAPPVAVCSHLDTVFPAGTDIDIRHEGTRLTGPGVVDNSRGLAVMLAIAEVLQRSAAPLSRAIEFVATTGEEGVGDLRGVRHYLAETTPAALIAFDGAGDDRIVNVAVGARRFRIEFFGPGGHSWASFGAPNPIHAAARTAAQLADLALPRGGRSTLTVSRAGGGHSVNSIPEHAWFEVDARSTDERSLARLEDDIRAAAQAMAHRENETQRAGGLTLRVTRVGSRPSGATEADSALVTTALEATRLIGRMPELATGSTDANAAMALGIPAIAIGGGGLGGDTHTSHEWYENTRGGDGVARALTIVAAMASSSD